MLTPVEQNLFERFKILQNQLPDYDQPWVKKLRDDNLQHSAKLGLPTRKNELWKYTDIGSVVDADYWQPAARQVIKAENLAPFALPELETIRLVFVNGYYDSELSHTGYDRDSGALIVESLSDALAHRPLVLKDYLGSLSSDAASVFSAINTGLTNQGAVIIAAADRLIEKPVHVLFLNTGQINRFSTHPRLLIIAGENSGLNVIEHYASLDETGESLNNTVTEIFLAPGSRCRYSKLLQENDGAVNVGSTYVQQDDNSEFESHAACLGGGMVRNDLNIQLTGQGAQCRLNGIYLARDRQHVDNHTVIEHIAPRCNSREFYKGLITDRSHAVFNGRIHIHPGAQKSDAQLQNKNLLLSAMAEIDTKPELEIYADDVKCSHGATVGELDPQAIFYLQSRGIEAGQARHMLSRAFINELIEQFPHGLREKIHTIIDAGIRPLSGDTL